MTTDYEQGARDVALMVRYYLPAENFARLEEAIREIVRIRALSASPEVKPTGEPCPHLRVGIRDGKPWTCRDCGAVRVNGEWSAAPADARLVAAAPELLDALRFIHEHAFEAKWSGDERALELVEAAIAKAEGRAP